MRRPIITLTTDFGERDNYVAQMKGVILGINAEAQLVDVTHAVPAQDVLRAAVLLDGAIDAFPDETVHLVVVDPGVGTERAMVAADMGGRRFVAPDNGVLSLAARRYPPERIIELTEPKFWRQPVSNTFHGRDVMGPVAAHWSLGVAVEEFGRPLERGLVELPVPQPEQTAEGVVGEVLWVDAFGNLVTNIEASLLPGAGDRLVIEANGHIVHELRRSYGEVPPGTVLALVGSSGHLEIAVNQGSACAQLRLEPGVRVAVRKKSTEA